MTTITTYQLETIINIAREDYYTFNKAFQKATGESYSDYSDAQGADYTISWNLRHALNHDDADYLIACISYDEEYIPCDDDFDWLMACC